MNSPNIFSMWTPPVLAQGEQVLGSPSTGEAGAPVVGADGGAAGPGGAAPGPSLFGGFIPILLVMMVLMIVMTSMSGRKEKKRRAQLMSSMGKRDKVQTSSGIIGTIIEIKGEELLIETDRASNSRMRIAKGAVSQILRSEGNSEAEKNEFAGNGVEEK